MVVRSVNLGLKVCRCRQLRVLGGLRDVVDFTKVLSDWFLAFSDVGGYLHKFHKTSKELKLA